jgi:hypothetical protein
MYSDDFYYYYADGDMSRRAHVFGYTHKSLNHIKVCSIYTNKHAIHRSEDPFFYDKNHEEYKKGILNDKIKLLK